jgi:hypothetical protein
VNVEHILQKLPNLCKLVLHKPASNNITITDHNKLQHITFYDMHYTGAPIIVKNLPQLLSVRVLETGYNCNVQSSGCPKLQEVHLPFYGSTGSDNTSVSAFFDKVPGTVTSLTCYMNLDDFSEWTGDQLDTLNRLAGVYLSLLFNSSLP